MPCSTELLRRSRRAQLLTSIAPSLPRLGPVLRSFNGKREIRSFNGKREKMLLIQAALLEGRTSETSSTRLSEGSLSLHQIDLAGSWRLLPLKKWENSWWMRRPLGTSLLIWRMPGVPIFRHQKNLGSLAFKKRKRAMVPAQSLSMNLSPKTTAGLLQNPFS